MTIWIAIAGAAAVLFAVIIRLGKLPRPTWEPLAAALVLALAGYAWQGRPNLAASPAQPLAAKNQETALLIDMRASMDRNFGTANQWLVMSDAFARKGDYPLAASLLQAGLNKNPRSADLWAALGLQLMLASNGKISAPAQFAFDKTRSMSPAQPAPDYFEGLAALFDGRPDETLVKWRALYDRAPADAKWKPTLESQLKRVEAVAAAIEQRRTEPNINN